MTDPRSDAPPTELLTKLLVAACEHVAEHGALATDSTVDELETWCWLASHLPEMLRAQECDEIAWVMVCGQPSYARYPLLYFTGRAFESWSEKHERALRFARKQDAETMMRFEEDRLRQFGYSLPAFARVEEHVWTATPVPSSVQGMIDERARLGKALEDSQEPIRVAERNSRGGNS